MIKTFLHFYTPVLTLLLLGVMINLNAQFTEQAKIVGDFRESRAEFGTSVDFNDEFIAVGASRETIASGAVYIYKMEGDDITFHQKLTAFDAQEMAEFGGGVQFMNDYLVVASGRADVGDWIRSGALYIYTLDADGNWVFDTKLVASNLQGSEMIGANPTSLATGGNQIAVGAIGLNNWTGAAFIFENNNGEWVETQKITPPDGLENATFGSAVSFSEDYLLIGAGEANSRKGKVYIFKKNEQNALWEFYQDVEASDAQNSAFFGSSVSIYGNQFVVGAYAEQTMSSEIPAAYIFELDISGQWNEIQRIGSHDSNEDTHFGWHCEMTEDMLYISAPHIFGLDASRVTAFTRNENGVWEEVQTLFPSDNFNAFSGWDIAAHGDRVLIGAPRNDFDENGENEMGDAGAAFMFKQTTLGMEEILWNQNSIHIYPNPVENQLNISSKEAVELVEIYTISGQKLMTSNAKQINVSHLNKGIYVVKITSVDGKTETKKLVKK